MLSKYLSDLFDNKGLSPYTLKARIGFLLSIPKVFEGEFEDLSFLNDFKTVALRVEDSEVNSTRFNRYNYIIKAIEALKEDGKDIISDKAEAFYRKSYEKYDKAKETNRNDNRMTQKQADNFESLSMLQIKLNQSFDTLFNQYDIKTNRITKADIERLGSNLYKFAAKYQELVILSCYIYQPALRDDYSHMKFSSSIAKTKNKDFNYFRFNRQWNNVKLVMNTYKNSKIYGRVEIECTAEFKYVMREWYHFLCLILNVKQPEYVFLYEFHAKDKSISWIDSKNGLTQKIKRSSLFWFDKDLSINSFRHIWEIHFQENEDYKKMTIGESEAIHKLLLHNYDTAKRYALIKDHPNGPKV